MTIELLKQAIESKTLNNDLIIFKISDTDIIANQYINAIAAAKSLRVEFIESLMEITARTTSIFDLPDMLEDNVLKVLRCDSLESQIDYPHELTNTILIVKNIDKACETNIKSYIVSIPKLEPWQLREYAEVVSCGADKYYIDKLLAVCGSNQYRLINEIDKLLIFTDLERKFVLQSMIEDGAISDLSDYSIFNFTNAILTKDINTLMNIFCEIKNVDINEFGLLTILVKNFRNLLKVQLNINPTTDNTGLESKQLYAIKKLPRVYSEKQLLNAFTFICDLDRKVKNGELPTEIFIEYVTLKLLSF